MRVILLFSVDVLGNEGEELTIPKGTEVYFDYKESIAFWNDIHFYLSRNEYSTLM